MSIVSFYDVKLFGGASQLFQSTNNTLELPNHSDNRNPGNRWKYNSNQQEYQVLDAHRFVPVNGTDIKDIDFSDLKIQVTKLDEQNPKPFQFLTAYIGDQFILPEETTGPRATWTFDFSKPEIQQVINGRSTQYQNEPGLFNITFVPLYDENTFLTGDDSILVSFGENYYDYNAAGNFDSAPITLKTSESFENYNINFLNQIPLDNDGGKTLRYDFYVGALADFMLKQQNSAAIDLAIDGMVVPDGKGGFLTEDFVQTSNLLLSQNILYRRVDNNNASEMDWKMLTLGYDNQLLVRGGPQEANSGDFTKRGALVSGAAQIDEFFNHWQDINSQNLPYAKVKWQYFAGMLDIASTYIPTNASNPSLAISGVTFADAPTRQQGGVQANSGFYGILKPDFWRNISGSNDGERFSNRLAAIANLDINGQLNNNLFDMEAGQVKVPVKFYDNRSVNWSTASDGFESMSPSLLSQSNFFLTNDDSIKVASRNGNFISNTIHQGQAGSAVMISDYGITNGPVIDNDVNGVYVHRVVSDDLDDKLGGIMGLRNVFNAMMIGKDNQGQDFAGIYNNTVDNLYVPKVGWENGGPQANVLLRKFIVPAASWSTYDQFSPLRSGFAKGLVGKANQEYATGGFNLRNWNFNQLTPAEPAVMFDKGIQPSGFPSPVLKSDNFMFFNEAQVAQPTLDNPHPFWFTGTANPFGVDDGQKVNVYVMNVSTDINNVDMATFQQTSTDALLDLENIINQVDLKINIETNSAYQNQLYLIKMEQDSITGDRFVLDANGVKVAVGDTDEFRSAVQENWLELGTPGQRFGGEGKSFELTLSVSHTEASMYAPVLVNPFGEIFTYGKTSSYGMQNLRAKVNPINTFYFEDIKGGGDNDFNDLICEFSVTN